MEVTEIDRLALKLRPHYSHFASRRPDEVLLTGHSHQAWPDVAREGQLAAWDDAARLVDGKWDTVFSEVIPQLADRIAERLGSSRPNDLAFAPNTHELVYRLLSCFPPNARVLTTDSEFHSLARQLRRAEEDGLQVTRVPVEPGEGFADRMIAALREGSFELVALSQVFFTTSRLVTRLTDILEVAAEHDIPVLVDVYHAYCALPLSCDELPGTTFVTGGGYKYAQCGEGSCFMLLPADATRFRPRQTGWFADFSNLAAGSAEVGYGPGGQRFWGATFDPTPFYRALHVMRWMDRLGLSSSVLREASLLRTEAIIELWARDRLDEAGLHLASPRDPVARGGFVAFEHPEAGRLSSALRARGIHTDVRGNLLRLGPAPYTQAAGIERAMNVLGDLVRGSASNGAAGARLA